eukprot:12537842-Ditylum_brightwellii.AAC.1
MTPKKHNCPRNYDDSSKGMEANAALILTRQLHKEKGVLLKKIVADGNSSMKALLRHSYAKNGQTQYISKLHMAKDSKWTKKGF